MDLRFHRKVTASWRSLCRWTRWANAPLVCLGIVWGMAAIATAEEPAPAFLDALRREGLLDLADHYLERCETSPITPTDFRPMIPFAMHATIIFA